MAELAAGAVNSLLGLIRNEALLLSRVRADVRFIKDEMESMKSFLAHLARTTPPGGGHDEQVRTWMKQVEELAHDCRDCVVVLYLHRGDPEVHRAMGGIQRYVLWFPWIVRKMVDQHRAASQLVELKERARDVSERRKRYDVQVPTNPSSSQAGHVGTTGALGYEEDDSDNEATMATANDNCNPRLLVASSPVDYCTEKLAAWIKLQCETEMERSFASISIVVPENEYNVAGDIVQQALEPYFHRSMWINLADVHHRFSDVPDRFSMGSPLDILSCILHEYMGEGTSLYHVQNEILRKVQVVSYTIETIKNNIQQYEDCIAEKNKTEESNWMVSVDVTEEPLGVLDQVLSRIQEVQPRWGPFDHTSVANALKFYMESEAGICLHVSQYEYVLQKVFAYPDHSSQEKQRSLQVHQDQGNLPAMLGQDNINGLIHSHKIALEIIREVLVRPDQVPGPGNNDSAAVKEKTISSDSASPITSASKTATGITSKAIAAAKKAKDKMDNITSLLKEQMMIKALLDKIEKKLKCEQTLIVLQDEMDCISRWKETINALNILPATSGPHAVIIITSNNQKAKNYCCPQGVPITLSLVGVYNDILIQLTSQRKTEDGMDILKIFNDILEKCNPDESCMKMFAHALYANPNRSYSELLMLNEALDPSEDSLQLGATNNFKKMFKFSYNDLPKDYRSCLLYLAIFPQGDIINRSIIVGRWVTEGLIDKEDWRTSVDHAETCFSTLINRWFICAVDIGPTGKVKSCVVGGHVHGIISKIAKKDRILDTRLSYHLAQHFSIFSGLQLSRSDSIQGFVHKLPEYSPQLPLVKVLHLEGCLFLKDNHSYLKNICNKMLLLKCLNLRGTGVTHLPREINNLHELEILDIRQTSVPRKGTRHVLLLKLRRLLVGDTDSNGSGNGIGITKGRQKSAYTSSGSIPYKIEKMENLEGLSNVIASSHAKELKDISKLWQLRKLGVVINDDDSHLFNLLQAIGDLKESLQSVSITIAETRKEETSIEPKLLTDRIYSSLVQPPKLLESVSINGRTNRVRILSLLGKGSSELDKVVLTGTMLEQRNLKVLDSLPKLSCIRLRHLAYNDPQLIFNEEEFEHLKCLLIDGPNMTDINFVKGAAVALEKIVLSSTNIKYLHGVGHLPKLKELELKGNELFDSFSDDVAAQKTTEPVSASSEDKAAPQRNTQPVSLPQEGGVPHNQTQVASPKDDGAVSQKNTESVQLPLDGATSEKKTELVSLSEVGQAPQKNSGLVSPSEDGAAPPKNTERSITFKKEEFKHLKCFHFEDRRMINIIFENGAAPELEKIILYMSSKESKVTVSGSLPKLREIEVKGDKSIFLSLLKNAGKINKVTICDTLLKKGDDLYKLLSSEKPSIWCLELLDKSYDESKLTFDEDELSNLKLLIIKCSKIRNINFNGGSCRNLEKIIWFYDGSDALDEIQITGMDNIGKLKEIELNGDCVPRQLTKDIEAHKNKPVLRYDKPQ